MMVNRGEPLRRLFKRISLYLLVLTALAGINILSVSALSDKEHIYPSVTAGEIKLGGLSIEDATAVLESGSPISLLITVEDRNWKLELKDIDLVIDELQTAQNAYWQPRQGSLLRRFFAFHTNHQIRPVLTFDEEKLNTLINSYEKEIYLPAKSASIQHQNENDVVITPEVSGRELNNGFQTVKDAILTLQPTVSLTTHEVKPAITTQELQHINSVLAEYRTSFNPQETARTHNILLASRSLNGTLLRPGEVFSFNQTVGPRSEQRGYHKAPTYVNGGKLVDDWGGGICQVSSALYNAALLADLAIIERSPHFRPPEYVPIGLDATVDFDSKLDLKLKNTLPESVYFSVEVQDIELIIKILGKALPDKPTIRIVTSDLTVIEPHTEFIQDITISPDIYRTTQLGHSGFRVSTTKVRELGGHEISRELLSEDIYDPIDQIVRVGAKTEDESK